MRISFLVNEIAGGWKPTDARLGGTEESVVRWAECLRTRGYKVDIYDNDNRNSYPGGYDVCINVKSIDKKPLEPTLYLTNETDATRHDLSAYEGVIWPSQWAVDNIETNAKKTFILPHGYDPKNIWSDKKFKKQCFYASSPDRGLETLLAIWPTVYERHPDATLLLTYGAAIKFEKGVINLGEVDEETMNEIFRTSDFWLHPCNGGELYCMTGIKAQAAGCIPVIIPRMALSETVRHGFFAKDESDYVKMLDIALSASDEVIDDLRGSLLAEKYPDWEASTSILEKIIKTVYSKSKSQ